MAQTQNFIDPKRVKQLSVLTPWKTIAAIAFDWLIIGASIAVSVWAQNIWVYLLAVLLIGGRMHAFGVLVHEFAHYRFVADKGVTDWVGNVLAGWAVLTTVDGYRNNHLEHHRYTNSERDPDWMIKLGKAKYTFPQSWQRLALHVLSYFVAIGAVMDLAIIIPRLSKDNSTRLQKRTRLAFYLAFAVLFTLTGTWMGFLLYWVVPYFTIFFLLLYVRGIAEHFGGLDYDSQMGGTRTVIPYLWENLFFSPHRVNFHVEHHLYPSVPYYNLPALHRDLMNNPAFAAQAHVTKGYSLGLVRECLAGNVEQSSSPHAPAE